MPGFQTTRWSLVLAAGGEPSEQSRGALASLFERYWYPMYAYVRSKQYSQDDARDLVQSYFASILEKRGLRGLHPDAGRFRAFLLVSLRNFISHDREGRGALKRGGARSIESLDAMTAEARLAQEPFQLADAEAAFERRWAATVVQRAMDRLETEFRDADQIERYRLLRGLLTGEGTLPYSELAERLSVSEQGVKSMARRIRLRFGVLLRHEVQDTVHRTEDVDLEIRQLLTALSKE